MAFALPPTPTGPPAAQSVRLLAATPVRARPHGRVVARLPKLTRWGSPRFLPVVAERRDALGVLAPELGNGRVGWISMRANVYLAPADWRVDISLGSRRVTVRASGRVMQSFPVAIGAAATPTPTGTYGVTDKLFLDGGSPYGCCALALSARQPHLAQGWGGGDRIAIHGTSNPSSVGRAISHGCLRAYRRDIDRLVRTVPLGTPVYVR